MAGTVKVGHINQRLSDTAFAFKQENFAWSALFTEHPVDKGSDEYTVFDKGNLHKNVDDTMGKLTKARAIEIGETTTTYTVKNRALKGVIPQEDVDNADDPLNPKIDKTESVTSALLLAREIRAAALATGLATNTATPGVKWTFVAGDPVTDIEDAANGMFIRPNTAVISRDVWDKLKFNDKILAIIGGGFTGIKMATPDLFRDAFGLDTVVIAGARKNANKDPKVTSLTRVWGKDMVLAFVDPRKGRDVATFGRLFAQKLNGGRTFQTREWQDPNLGVGGATIVQVEHRSVEQLIAEDYGFVIKDAIA